MEKSKMRNMIVLKDLPSNLVDEAVVFLKAGKNAKRLEKIDKMEKEEKNKKERIEKNPKEKDYIIKDAELVISNYILKLEDMSEQKRFNDLNNNSKYIKYRNYSIIVTIIVIIQALLLI